MGKKFRLFVSAFLVFLITASATLSPAVLNQAAAQGENEFEQLRGKWKEMLTGGEAFDPSDPDIANRIKKIDEAANEYWNSMDKSSDRSALWTDLTGTSNSSYITKSYDRLLAMALALSTKGSSLENNETLKNDLIQALDWMYTYRYNENKPPYNNWWDWEIGTPLRLNNIVILLYSHLSTQQITNYMKAVEKFSPTPTGTGANRVWKVTVVAVRGMIVEDSSKLSKARDGLSNVFTYVTSGDGFYKDGSFIQHNNFAYNGGYGRSMLADIANVMYLLSDSTWQITDSNQQNVYRWVYDSFEPLIYKGAMMDMVRGRELSRHYAEDHVVGHETIQAIIRLAQSASESNSLVYKEMVKSWIKEDTHLDFVKNTPSINMIQLAKSIVNDPAIGSRKIIKYQQFSSMDRAVLVRDKFAFGISMSSARIANYESINGENLKGWYTGEGMTYLYNNDTAQYSDGYWPTVNPYRLPGTTVDTRQRTNSSGHAYASSKRWVGGTEMQGTYGVSGMTLDAYNSTLDAKKSWFMFDDEIVAVGSGITSTDQRTIETIIENRKLKNSGDNTLIVNGYKKPAATGWTEKMDKVRWAYLSGNVESANIGYYFPDQPTIKGLRESRTGAWSQIDSRSGIPTESITRNYLNLWFDHGVNPTNQKYSYVLLPNMTSTSVLDYSCKPEISIVENSADAHAVKEKTLNLIGINFWNDKVKTVGGITSDKKASVMVRETESQLEVSVSDPTQINTGVINIEIDKSVNGILRVDEGIDVNQARPTIKLSVNVNQAKGKTFKAVFNK
ncbi:MULTISPECIES: polysaccharide lyase 8 family protein [Bacillus]|uniref:Hyaluronate lyase n=2 Tax=Bacillus TaxID=1386 RepID=A0A0M5J9I4_9BACI|nr:MULTISPECIES: polysaccharide lyase 8 family protein [Bacillus]ALC80364.1 hypothetical protein AM592_01170 [Bacillus gobiensis]MBP1083790.1 hyaluronate lyase [Bacillus capparidis]MED1098275.1 polysaccharide lyase 8 family protein [Bacillus capparidis]